MDKNDEKLRLNTLKLYHIMDTQAEKAFDDLTKLAATICEVPISLVSLLDDTRQWFKSHHGLEATETPKDQAFCAHAIENNELMIVEDASLDVRFNQNPLVTGDPLIRFYAGAPLQVSNGQRLGTLCVIDRVPRKLSRNQQQSLLSLRDAVVTQLELRRALLELEEISGYLSVCAWCRKVRVDDMSTGEAIWKPMHDYLCEMNTVTHGMCPDCKNKVK